MCLTEIHKDLSIVGEYNWLAWDRWVDIVHILFPGFDHTFHLCLARSCKYWFDFFLIFFVVLCEILYSGTLVTKYILQQYSFHQIYLTEIILSPNISYTEYILKQCSCHQIYLTAGCLSLNILYSSTFFTKYILQQYTCHHIYLIVQHSSPNISHSGTLVTKYIL